MGRKKLRQRPPFFAAATVTVLGSVRMTGLGDALADRTGCGEALFGAVINGETHTDSVTWHLAA